MRSLDSFSYVHQLIYKDDINLEGDICANEEDISYQVENLHNRDFEQTLRKPITSILVTRSPPSTRGTGLMATWL